MIKQLTKAIALVALVAALFPSEAQAQRRSTGDFFAGFDYFRLNLEGGGDVTAEDSLNMYGFHGEINYYFRTNIAVAVELVFSRGSIDTPGLEAVTSVDFSQATIMIGPKFLLGSSESFVPSVHALAGMAIGRIDEAELEGIGGSIFGLADETVFAVALGAAFDARINPTFSYRIIQPDLVITNYGSETQSNVRISTGIVVRF